MKVVVKLETGLCSHIWNYGCLFQIEGSRITYKLLSYELVRVCAHILPFQSFFLIWSIKNINRSLIRDLIAAPDFVLLGDCLLILHLSPGSLTSGAIMEASGHSLELSYYFFLFFSYFVSDTYLCRH